MTHNNGRTANVSNHGRNLLLHLLLGVGLQFIYSFEILLIERLKNDNLRNISP